MSETKQLLRILCIHGYRQNGQTFREKTGSLRKVLKKYGEFTFITALHKVPPGNMGSAAWANEEASDMASTVTEAKSIQENEGERGWWFSRADDYFKSTDYSECDKGFDESLQQVISVLEDGDVKFDGVIGFSQGASLLSILCLIQEKQKKQWFKFAVLISGFKSPSSRHDVHYENKNITLPTLHVYGEGDEIVTCDRSEHLSSYFENPKCMVHPGGHFVPATSAQKQTYLEFFEQMKILCSSNEKSVEQNHV